MQSIHIIFHTTGKQISNKGWRNYDVGNILLIIACNVLVQKRDDCNIITVLY